MFKGVGWWVAFGFFVVVVGSGFIAQAHLGSEVCGGPENPNNQVHPFDPQKKPC
jgi:hypothetical protein